MATPHKNYMKSLIISDIHLTNETNENYRWDVFSLAKQYVIDLHCDCLFILGDIFDKKDRHPSSIVNRLTDILLDIAKLAPITILKGNHDYINPNEPFLRFLNHIPNVYWINQPTIIRYGNITVGWLPHSRTPELDWEAFLTKHQFDLIFMHQSVIGCRTSNDFEINHALDLAWLERLVKCPIISGDIHVPQTIRSLTYVGTQHPVSFGDDYDYRMLVTTFTDKIKVESIPIESMKRHSLNVTSIDDLRTLVDSGQLRKGDQAKLKINLTEETLSDWTHLKTTMVAWCSSQGIQVEDVKLKKLENNESSELLDKSAKAGYAPNHPLEALARFTNTGIDPKISKIGESLLLEVLNETIAR